MSATIEKEKISTKAAPKKLRCSLKMRLRMLTAMDSVLGENLSKTGKTLLFILCTALAGWILYLILQVFVLPPVQDTQSPFITPDTAREMLNILFSILTMVITAVTAVQVYMMKDINHMEMSHNIFDDNQTFRKDMHKAHQQLFKLSDVLTPSTNFDDTYLLADWEDLRAFAYHHEYMGYLVFRNRLNFDIVFDTVAFPNWLINSPEAKKVIAAGRHNTPDFWNGSTHLYLCYEIRRKYNKRNALRHEWRGFSAKERKKAKKILDKKAVLQQQLIPLQEEYTAQNVLMHLWHTEQAFKNTCYAWKSHYITLPE